MYISLYGFSDVAGRFPLLRTPRLPLRPRDPATIHYVAREGIYTVQERDRSMNAELQIFNQYSLSTAIYSSKLNKMKHLCCFVKSKTLCFQRFFKIEYYSLPKTV